MATYPTKAVLQKILTYSTVPDDGTTYAVGYAFDADNDRHLVMASSSSFGDLKILPLMVYQEINLAMRCNCLEVLPLSAQSEELQQIVKEKLPWLEMRFI